MRLVALIVLASACGVTRPHPVRGTVTGAAEALRINPMAELQQRTIFRPARAVPGLTGRPIADASGCHNLVDQFLTQVIDLGGDGSQLEHKDGCEKITAIKPGFRSR